MVFIFSLREVLFNCPRALAFNSIWAIHTWCWTHNKNLSKSLWSLLIYWPGFNDDDGVWVGLKEGEITMHRCQVPRASRRPSRCFSRSYLPLCLLQSHRGHNKFMQVQLVYRSSGPLAPQFFGFSVCRL